MNGPHDLLNTCIGKRNCLKQVSAWVIRRKRAMILRMPIPCEIYVLVSRFERRVPPNLLDDGEDRLVVGHFERTACAEIVLHVDDNEGSDFIIGIGQWSHIFARRATKSSHLL